MQPLDWTQIDTVLLDMDGTLLDLHFDNYFWLEHLPARYAQIQGISREAAMARLEPLFVDHAGKLTWYCLDFWGQELGLDLTQLKQEVAHLIAPQPGVFEFLQALSNAGKRSALITNAHRGSLSLKLERIELAPYLDRIISSHDYQKPKEDPLFWQALEQDFGFEPSRTLFIDDSVPILRSAQRFGIGHLLGVRYPDSKQSAKDSQEFAALEHWSQLTQMLAP